jgi:hypothetical protein
VALALLVSSGAALLFPPLPMGLLINSVAYAAIVIVIVIVRLVARFTGQLMWRWFLLDTLREVAPPRSRSPDMGDILDGGHGRPALRRT